MACPLPSGKTTPHFATAVHLILPKVANRQSNGAGGRMRGAEFRPVGRVATRPRGSPSGLTRRRDRHRFLARRGGSGGRGIGPARAAGIGDPWDLSRSYRR
jgi:hypothetical protein